MKQRGLIRINTVTTRPGLRYASRVTTVSRQMAVAESTSGATDGAFAGQARVFGCATRLTKIARALALLAQSQTAALHAAAEKERSASGVALSLGECTRLAGRIAVTRAAAGEELFSRAWADGEGFSIDAVVRRALDEAAS